MNDLGRFGSRAFCQSWVWRIALGALLLLPGPGMVRGQSSLFRFEGWLGPDFDGLYELSFRLFPSGTEGTALGTPVARTNVLVAGGVYTVDLDFGMAAFDGNPRWIEVTGRPAGEAASTPGTTFVVEPRSFVGSTPYAIRALTAGTAQSANTVPWSGVTGVPGVLSQSAALLASLFQVTNAFTPSLEIGSITNADWPDREVHSGAGMAAGRPEMFSALRLQLRAASPARPVSKVRCRIKAASYEGAVLADGSAAVSISAGEPSLVIVPLGTTVTNAAKQRLWVEFFADAQVLAAPGGLLPRDLWFADGASTDDLTMDGPVAARPFYIGFGTVSGSSLAAPLAAALQRELGLPTAESVRLDLPSVIPAAVGIEANIYFANVLRQDRPPAPGLSFDVVCEKGSQFEKGWRFTPTAADLGEYPFVLRVLYGTRVVAEQSARLRVAPLRWQGRLLMIGDSTTAEGTIANELVALSDRSPTFAPTLVGSVGVSPRGRFEAFSGWTARMFCTAPESPFSFGGQFNFRAYLATRRIELGAGDCVLINLGINEMRKLTNETDLALVTDQAIACFKQMAAAIQSAGPGLAVGFALTIPPSDSQDAFGQDYAASQTLARYRRNRDLFVARLLAEFDGKQKRNIYVVPISLGLDTVYGYPFENVPVSSRVPLTTARATSSLHPGPWGYAQIADTIAAFLCQLPPP